jgi:hypothetical protein
MADSPAFSHRAQPTIFTEEQQIEAPQKQFVLPTIFIKLLEKSNATPIVKNILKFKLNNTGAQNITYFLKGQEGQDIMILGDGHSVLKHDVTKIKNLSGADINPAATNTIYKYILMNGIWIQH